MAVFHANAESAGPDVLKFGLVSLTIRQTLALVRIKPKPHEEMKLSKATKNRSGKLKRKATTNSNDGKGNRPKAGGKTK